ncbi:MAG TPA: zonular occludens toxin domain-containing protein [Oculatellaceae cyanobacterium]
MANWTLTGELGSGKSIIAVGKIRDFLEEGRAVATNMDIYLEKLMPPSSKATITRLLDFPDAPDLWALGLGCPEKDESRYGGLFLDELAVFLNARFWQGKARDEVIKYLRHVRKQHWHTFFITQDIESLDAQARRALIEHKVSCKRTDRLSIPLVGWLIRLLGLGSGYLPRSHWGIVRYGKDDRSPIVETWKYWGSSLHEAYDTDQVFRDEPFFYVDVPQYKIHYRPLASPVLVPDGYRTVPVDQVGTYTVLSAWHLKGRYLNFYQRHKPVIRTFFVVLLCLFLMFFWAARGEKIKHTVTKPAASTLSAEPFTKSLQIGNSFVITTQDGRVLKSDQVKIQNGNIYVRVGKKWYVKQ